MGAALVTMLFLAAPPDELKEAPPPASVAAADDDSAFARRVQARRELLMQYTVLATASIVLMFVGVALLAVRLGRRLRRLPKAKPVKYFDLTVDEGPEPPPHELSAEERRKPG